MKKFTIECFGAMMMMMMENKEYATEIEREM